MNNEEGKKQVYVAPQFKLVRVKTETNVMCASDKDLIDDEAS